MNNSVEKDLKLKQLERINQLILELAAGNFDYHITLDNGYDDLDCIVAGIHMLGEELKESTVSRDYLDSIYKGIVDLCFLLDKKGNIISVNSTVDKMLEYEPGFLIGKPFKSLFINDNPQKNEKYVNNLFNDGYCYNIEKNFLTFKNESLPVSCSCSILYDNKKEISGFLYIAKDISVQKKYEEELKTEKERYELALRASNDGIWDWDLQNKVYYFSIRWKEMLGYHSDELPNNLESWIKTIHEDDKAIAFKKIDEYNEGKISEFKIIQRYYHKNGQILYMLSRCINQKNEMGEVTRMIWSHTDITFQKHAELELKTAKEQAEMANLAKGNFLDNMSHEIRTPLNGILGFTDCLINTDLNQEQKEYLSMIKDSGTILFKLLGDVLDLSRIEAGKLMLELNEFDFRKNLSTSLTSYESLAKEKGIDFSFRFDDMIPQGTLIGDAAKINQIISHLLTNAIKFTSEGKIFVEFKLKEGAIVPTDDVNIEGIITDTGVGVPNDKKSIIFESFTQADSSVTRQYGGSGLGLSIVKQLLLLMGGSISVKSPVSNDTYLDKFPGSEFSFFFKLKRPKTAEQKTVPEAKKQDGKIVFNKSYKVLVVDDNEMNQILAKRVLKDMGCEVIVVDDGQKAVEASLKGEFDVILMDVQMPVMNGVDATVKIRENNFTNPIFAFSAHVGKEDIEKCLASGMNGYIPKPFTKQEIFDAISSL